MRTNANVGKKAAKGGRGKMSVRERRRRLLEAIMNVRR
jgi:hypothetical protein